MIPLLLILPLNALLHRGISRSLPELWPVTTPVPVTIPPMSVPGTSRTPWQPINVQELATKAIHALNVVQEVHSRGLVYERMSKSFLDFEDHIMNPLWFKGAVPVPVTRNVAKNPLALTRLRRRDLVDAIQIFIDIADASPTLTVPKELVVVKHRAMYDDGPVDYDAYKGIIERILHCANPDVIDSVKKFYRALTVDEFLYIGELSMVRQFRLPRFFRLDHDDSPMYMRGNLQEGHIFHRYTATSVGGNRIDIRFPYDYFRMPLSTMRESAVLHVLREVEGVPRIRYLQPRVDVGHIGRSRLLITEGSHFWTSLEGVKPVTPRHAVKLAIRGLTILRSIHDLGFIHGSVKSSKLVVNSLTKTSRSLMLLDYSHAHPWDTKRPFRTNFLPERSMDQSIFELQGSPLGVRDDLFRFVEVLLQILGEEDFDNDGFHRDIPVADALQLKIGRKIIATGNVPMPIIELYSAVQALELGEVPVYDDWIGSCRAWLKL